MPTIDIEVRGLSQVIDGLGQLTESNLTDYLAQAGHEAAVGVVLPTEGLQRYPPATEANSPPTPYYERGRGTWSGGRRVPLHNLGNSERLGSRFGQGVNATDTSWHVRQEGWTTVLSNSASYAQLVVGEQQAGHMARIGWRRLADVANERVADISRVYQAWFYTAF